MRGDRGGEKNSRTSRWDRLVIYDVRRTMLDPDAFRHPNHTRGLGIQVNLDLWFMHRWGLYLVDGRWQSTFIITLNSLTSSFEHLLFFFLFLPGVMLDFKRGWKNRKNTFSIEIKNYKFKWQIKISHFVPEGAIEGCSDWTRSVIFEGMVDVSRCFKGEHSKDKHIQMVSKRILCIWRWWKK